MPSALAKAVSMIFFSVGNLFLIKFIKTRLVSCVSLMVAILSVLIRLRAVNDRSADAAKGAKPNKMLSKRIQITDSKF